MVAVLSYRSDDAVDQASKLHDRAVDARAKGRLKDAEKLGLRALRLFEEAVGPRHPDVANVLNLLAGIQEDLGNYAQAQRLFQRSVKIMDALRDGDAIGRLQAQSLSGLAGVLRAQGSASGSTAPIGTGPRHEGIGSGRSRGGIVAEQPGGGLQIHRSV
jgi:tetratricopeptide (TPR) repeat protein